MALKEQLMADFKDAMKAHDEVSQEHDQLSRGRRSSSMRSTTGRSWTMQGIVAYFIQTGKDEKGCPR